MSATLERERDIFFDGPWLMSPMDYESFARTYWSQSPLRIARNNTTYYANLLSEADLEFALHAACKMPNAVDELVSEEQSQNCRSHSRAVTALKEGKSLRINSIQNFSRPITMLCRNLEQLLSCPINVNLYFTPGAGKALPRHFDTHDVFVLQIHGQKRWRLFDAPSVLPLEFLPQMRGESHRDMRTFRLAKHTAAKPTGGPADDFILEAGDFLYVPRGYWHEAEGVPGTVSCHLTVGIQPITYTDLLTLAMAQVANKDARLRQPLPLGFATHTDGSDVVCSQVAEILQTLSTTLDARNALAELGAIFRRNRKAALENSLLRAFDDSNTDKVQLESQVHVREGLVCGIDSNVSPSQIAFGPKAFSIVPAYEEACRFIVKNRQFVVSALPGNLTSDEKLALVQQLVVEGFLKVSKGIISEAETADNRSGWLPIRVNLAKSTIEWMYFGNRPLQEPLFQQSIRRCAARKPTPKSKTTSLEYAITLSEDIPPSGFIFHISRCGSTLVANGLRAISGTVMISEAQPVSALFGLPKDKVGSPEYDTQIRKHEECLKAIIKAYGQRRSENEKSLVLKLSSWNILQMSMVRRLWPKVPCVVVIREPLEVAVSCLEQSPGWMRWKLQPKLIASLLGWEIESISEMTDGRFCARMLGEFCRSALTGLDSLCRVVDYEDLGVDSIEDIANFLGIPMGPNSRENIQACLSFYSKDPARRRPFIRDQHSKRNKASDLLRQEIQEYAQNDYENVKYFEKTARSASI